MPTAEKIAQIKKLGIFAGGGQVPFRLVAACQAQGIEPFILGVKGQTDAALMDLARHSWIRVGAAGQLMAALRAEGMRDLVMIGKIHRPSLWDIRPDWTAAKILARIGYRALGDDGLLSALRRELEREGFTLHGVHIFCPDLLARDGFYGPVRPSSAQEADIALGLKASQDLGAKDIGQAVAVQAGKILAMEGADGTNAVLRRAGPLRAREGHGPILVKTCKPQQDRDLDLPTIGPNTLEIAYSYGFSGIVVQAGASLVVEAKTIEERAEAYNMFVMGSPVRRAEST